MHPTWHPPRRPGRLDAAVAVVVLNAAVLVGLIALALIRLADNGPDPLFDLTLAVMIPGLIGLGFVAYGLATGRPSARFAVLVTLPLQVPLYVLFIALLGPQIVQRIEFNDTVADGRDFWTVVLCAVGVVACVTGPLLVAGERVRGYLAGR